MAYSNLTHGTERKGRSVILEREIFNLQSKNPRGTPLYGRMRGSIGNLKAVEKIIHNCKTAKPQKKKTRPEPKTACKTVKTDKCAHPSSQNPNRSDTVLTSGVYRGFAAVRDHWGSIMATWIEDKTESKWDNPKISSETKSVAH